MNVKSKKSIKDFKGQAMPKAQQQTVKGGNGIVNSTADFIIMDDIMDC
jgi:hypothetical protein